MSLISLSRFTREGGSRNLKNERTYNISYLAVSNSVLDDTQAVRTAFINTTGITLGTVYPSDPKAWCKELRCEREGEDGLNWLITVEYGPPEKGGSNATCPWQLPAEVSWSGETYEQVLVADVNGKPIVNTAGQYFAEPLSRDQSRVIVSITQNEQVYLPALANLYADTINSNNFLGARPGTVKCNFIGASRQWDQEWGYWYKVSYVFHYRAEGWKRWILSQGFYELNSDDNKLYAICRPPGVPITVPAFLDENGKALPDGTTEGYWQSFDVYPKVPFTFTFR